MKLAKAAAQHLKGVIVEYDVLCSTLIGESMAEQAEQRRRKLAADKAKQQKEERFGSSLFGPSSVKSMLISDVRGLLKDLNQDSTGKPWAVKDRLQSTLQGLPTQILERVTGSPDQEKAAAGKSEDEIHLENQLASASETLARMKQQKEAARREKEQLGKLDLGKASGSSLRDKYLDKISKLKEKKKQEASGVSVPEPVVEPAAVTSAGLSTWIVNDGANEVLSYADLRGLFKAVIPPRDSTQYDEYDFFLKEMENQFDLFVSKEDQQKFPDPTPILSVCKYLGLEPSDILVLARHAPTISAAKAAGTHVCHYMPDKKAIPNHTAHYHLTSLRQFQHLIEDFNGISYRDKIKTGSIEF